MVAADCSISPLPPAPPLAPAPLLLLLKVTAESD